MKAMATCTMALAMGFGFVASASADSATVFCAARFPPTASSPPSVPGDGVYITCELNAAGGLAASCSCPGDRNYTLIDPTEPPNNGPGPGAPTPKPIPSPT